MEPVEGIAGLNLGQIVTARFSHGCRIGLNQTAMRSGGTWRVGVSALLRFLGGVRGSLSGRKMIDLRLMTKPYCS